MNLFYKLTEEKMIELIKEYDNAYNTFSDPERKDIEKYIINAIMYLEKFIGEETISEFIQFDSSLPKKFKDEVEKLTELVGYNDHNLDRIITCSPFVYSCSETISNKVLSAYENEKSTVGSMNNSFKIDITKFKGHIVSLLKGHDRGGDYGSVEFSKFKKMNFVKNKEPINNKILKNLFIIDDYNSNPSYDYDGSLLSLDLTNNNSYEKLIEYFPDGIVHISVDSDIAVSSFT